MSARLKSKIDRVQTKLRAVREQHARWHPFDLKTMDAWERMLEEIRGQASLAEHPVVKKWIAYCTKTVREINDVLLNDATLEKEERRILMEKRGMMTEALAIFVPRENAIEMLEHEAERELTPKNPQERRTYGGAMHGMGL